MHIYRLEGHDALESARTGEKFSRSLVLTLSPSLKERVFVHHDRVAPGRRTSSSHAHTRSDELVLVLRGELVAHVAGTPIRLPAGSYGTVPAGVPHWLANEGADEAEVLVIQSANPDDTVVYGPALAPEV